MESRKFPLESNETIVWDRLGLDRFDMPVGGK